MGCSQSTIDNDGVVSRCRDRKLFMKEAITSRNAFAAAHSAYVTSLRNCGAALADYAHFEVINPQFARNLSNPLIPSSFDKLPLRPPPLPDFPDAPLQRAVSMPQINIKKPDYETEPVGPTIEEEDENEIENDAGGLRRRRRNRRGSGTSKSVYREDVAMEEGPPPPILPPSSDEKWHPPPSQPHNSTFEYIFSVDDMPGHTLSAGEEGNVHKEEIIMSNELNVSREGEKADIESPVAESLPEVQTVPEKSSKKVKMVGLTGPVEGKRKGNLNLVQLFEEIDAHFLKASESAHEVSKMLEAIRLHYHSNFADDSGHVDHSARVMRVITWNQSFKRTPNFDGKDNLKLDQQETLSTILDKLLAWEKKLSSELKAGEVMKFEYDRKVAALNKLQKRGSNSEAFEKVKAAADHLHTRYTIDAQSIESTISEINSIRDKLLYTKLVQLVDGMATMWEIMRFHHESQLKIASALSSLDLSQSLMETSENHHDRTIQLWGVMQEWNLQFETLVTHQKDFVKSLYSWLKLNLIPIETSLEEKASSPPRVANPPIQKLLLTWHDFLDKLPDGQLRTSISTFSALINTIMLLQDEEAKIKSKGEEISKEYARKKRQFEDWSHRNAHQLISEDVESEAKDENTIKNVLQAKKSAVEALSKRLKEEKNVYERHCLRVREKSLVTLRIHLPELFKALSAFAHASSDMYRNLRSISSQVHSTKKNPT